MDAISISILLLLAVAALAGGALWRLSRLPRKQKKLLLKRHLRHGWRWLEEHGLVEIRPPLTRDYLDDYPRLELLERNWQVIQKECRELIAPDRELHRMQETGGRYTEGGVHDVDWTTFMLKSGRFIEENCARAPETTRLLRQIPGLSTAFFSILGPGQHIRAHWGYYKGFLRYHLGLIVPNDNVDRKCWLRVNDDRVAYDARDRSVIDQAEKYYWHEGEGVVFDDTWLHDAANEADSPRAVLFLDLRKPLPWYLHIPNVIFIWLAHFDPTVREIRQGAVVD